MDDAAAGMMKLMNEFKATEGLKRVWGRRGISREVIVERGQLALLMSQREEEERLSVANDWNETMIGK